MRDNNSRNRRNRNNNNNDDESTSVNFSVAGTNNSNSSNNDEQEIITRFQGFGLSTPTDRGGYVDAAKVLALRPLTSENCIAGQWTVSRGTYARKADNATKKYYPLTLEYLLETPEDFNRHSLKFSKSHSLSSLGGYTVLKHTRPGIPSNRLTDRKEVATCIGDDVAAQNSTNPQWDWDADGKYTEDTATREGRDAGLQHTLDGELTPETEDDQPRTIPLVTGLLGLPIIEGKQVRSRNKNWQGEKWNLPPQDDTYVKLTLQPKLWSWTDPEGIELKGWRFYACAEIQIEDDAVKGLTGGVKRTPKRQSGKYRRQMNGQGGN